MKPPCDLRKKKRKICTTAAGREGWEYMGEIALQTPRSVEKKKPPELIFFCCTRCRPWQGSCAPAANRGPWGSRDPPAVHGELHTEAGGCAWRTCDPVESLCCIRLMHTLHPWPSRKESMLSQVFHQDLWTCGGLTLDLFVEDCLPSEGSGQGNLWWIDCSPHSLFLCPTWKKEVDSGVKLSPRRREGGENVF